MKPIFESMGAQGVFDMGETIGAATVMKLVSNFLIVSAAHSMTDTLIGLLGARPTS